jgi:hypothetical protein
MVQVTPPCDFTHPCAAIGSKRLPQKEQKAAVFEISELPAKTDWKHPFAESANKKQQLAESTSSVLEALL